MKAHVIAGACASALFNLALLGPVQAQQAQQNRMSACAAEWSAMKAANQTAGKNYRAFQKECLARTAAATSAPAGQTGAPAGERPRAKKQPGGREAMLARKRACGQEWKAAKAAGTIPAGTAWPKYWSECNTRRKEAGT